eukprot:Nk52_evm30s232 gene=Nk52_evmTU30s232
MAHSAGMMEDSHPMVEPTSSSVAEECHDHDETSARPAWVKRTSSENVHCVGSPTNCSDSGTVLLDPMTTSNQNCTVDSPMDMDKESSSTSTKELASSCSSVYSAGKRSSHSSEAGTVGDDKHEDEEGEESAEKTEDTSIKLFVGQIPQHVDKDALMKLFEKYGEVLEISLMHHRGKNFHKGCGFVRFQKREDGLKAIEELHERHYLEGARSKMQVKEADSRKVNGHPHVQSFHSGNYFSTRNNMAGRVEENRNQTRTERCKLFVGMLGRDETEASVTEIFQPYGTVNEAVVIRTKTGASRGCAFVHMANEEECRRAIAILNKSRTFTGCNSPMVVKFANTSPRREHIPLQNGQNQFYVPNYGGSYGQAPHMAHFQGYYPAADPHFQQPYEYVDQMADPSVYQYNTTAIPYGGGMGGGSVWYPPPAASNMQVMSGCGVGGDGMQASGTEMMQCLDGNPYQGARQVQQAMHSVCVYNIPQEFSEESLFVAFSPFGRVLGVKIVLDYKGSEGTEEICVEKRFAYVDFENPFAAASAVKAMNGKIVGENQRLVVELKKQRRYQPY